MDRDGILSEIRSLRKRCDESVVPFLDKLESDARMIGWCKDAEAYFSRGLKAVKRLVRIDEKNKAHPLRPEAASKSGPEATDPDQNQKPRQGLSGR